jgi:hypothetical protein
MAHNPDLMDAKQSRHQQNLNFCVSAEVYRTDPVPWIEMYQLRALFMICGSLP